MENESNLPIVLITMDRAAACTVFTRSDGREARLPLVPSPFEDTSVLARLDFTPACGALLATTLSGDQILFEMPLEGAGDQLEGRFVVYLDQNQWSLLSNADRDRADAFSVGEMSDSPVRARCGWFARFANERRDP
ncbi:hypothetical protein ABZS86_36630 [Streptomyces sp. NPDC005355]|uniref:hypothetical protein n=1 Tax=Streptomyces sp. NPDC005355 TaxID=3157038 RepID=UPI0033ADCDFB